MIAPRLVMIRASAGSGKTFALTNRFIALLAAGAEPERIVALTFTRKAAGEFFDGILGKLADAAGTEATAHRLAAEIGRPQMRRADFLRLLRDMVSALHRLRLGTLDSFFARVAKTFPFELGLAEDFQVLEDYAARVERARVLRELFTRHGDGLTAEQGEFLEAFKRATFGTEDKQLGQRLDEFLDRGYEVFLNAPEAELWGNPARIWPRGQEWLGVDERPVAAIAALRRWLAHAAIEGKQRGRWENFLGAIELWTPGAVMEDELIYVLAKALVQWRELCGGGATLEFDRKKQELDAPACAALAEVVRYVAGGELRRRLHATQGLHAVLAGYDALYDARVRRAGRLSFADVERLLRPDRGAALSSAAAGDGGDRLLLDYRLDGGIDHWLLDEFQDTSRGQWSVLRNLIDEVVQDAEGRKTFFCVGDVKQSIYGWREGDPSLMGDIRRYYNGESEEPIVQLPLDVSWRSGPEVIALVNAVFGDHAAIRGLFPGRAAETWAEGWGDHSTARPDHGGQAALLHAVDAEDRHRQTLELIREIDPLRRGLTCAVLVRRNREATAIADYLRSHGGVPVVAESDLAVCTDNALGAALLAMVQVAAHPGDSLAWEHVQMTPLAGALAAEGVTGREALTTRVLAQIHEHGFEAFAEYWIERVGLDGEFARARARQFAAAAAAFDATGRRDPDEFLQFMRSHTLRDAESAAVVRVMTVHKSKGLGFDVVIVPELQGRKLNSPREGLAVHRGDERAVEWVLELPPAVLAQEDAVLRAHAEGSASDACYEALSLLYVALTRAKRALYVITEPVAAKSTSHNFPMLLAETLGRDAQPVRVGAGEFAGPWAQGRADWFADIAAKPAHAPPELPPATEAAPAIRRPALRPSAKRGGALAGAQLFALRDGEAASFGSEIHRLLAQVEWADEGDAARWEQAWRTASEPEEARAHALACLNARGLRELWRRPGGRAEVWRERAFEIVLDGAWVTGVFDRVVVERDAAGKAVAATVYDFKTDRVEEGDDAAIAMAAGRHAGQLQLYRRVAATLTGLAVAAVGAEVIFTRIGRTVAVPAG